MFTFRLPIISLASARRQVEALKREFEAFKRKHSRLIAARVLKPAADHIARLWEIAVEKKKPGPDAVDCVHIIADTGFRPLNRWNDLHEYIDHCQRYRMVLDPEEIIEKLLPPGRKINLSDIFPKRFPQW